MFDEQLSSAVISHTWVVFLCQPGPVCLCVTIRKGCAMIVRGREGLEHETMGLLIFHCECQVSVCLGCIG